MLKDNLLTNLHNKLPDKSSKNVRCIQKEQNEFSLYHVILFREVVP